MKGIERATTKRKGRTTTTFLSKWPKGSRATTAMAISPSAKTLRRRKEVGGELTPIRINVKKTMIFALASKW
jgi:hypothetical protein